MKENNKVLKERFIFIIGIVTLLIGLSFVKKAYDDKNNINTIEYYSYNITKTSDYYVTLKDNMFYDSMVLEKNKKYPSKLISKIPFELKYEFNGSKNTSISYSYNITAEILGSVENSSEENDIIWEKKYVLLANTINNRVESTGFTIQESVDINYNEYYKLVEAYEQSQNIDLSSNLKLTLNVDYNITIPDSNDTENNSDSIEIIIPLNDTVTQVDTSSNTTEPKTYTITENTEMYQIIIDVILAIILIVLGIGIIMSRFKKNEKDEYSKYQNNIEHIFKEYGDLIITSKNKPNLNDLRWITLETLDDVIDLAEQNKCNIIYHESIKNQKSNLYIIVDNYVYVYKITADTEL